MKDESIAVAESPSVETSSERSIEDDQKIVLQSAYRKVDKRKQSISRESS
jgi:hypothetical protein